MGNENFSTFFSDELKETINHLDYFNSCPPGLPMDEVVFSDKELEIYLILGGYDHPSQMRYGIRPIGYCVMKGKIEFLKRFLALGFDLNQRDGCWGHQVNGLGETLLGKAIRFNQIEVIELLLKNGSSVDLLFGSLSQKWTVIEYAKHFHFREAVDMLENYNLKK